MRSLRQDLNLNQIPSNKLNLAEKKIMFAKIAKMTSLPTPSASIMKLMTLLRDEDIKTNELIHCIEKDQALVAQILKLINSGFYGLRKTIDSVDRAVSLLGILNIKQIVYSASIMDFFSSDEQDEWNHAYMTSTMMATLIKQNELPNVNNLPLATLMHDLGKVVIRKLAPKKYQIIHMQSEDNHIPIYRIENTSLMFNHAEVGYFLLEQWDTAEDITKPVLYHHSETVPPDYVFETALMQFVNYVDCTVRNLPCMQPSQELLTAAGIEEIDFDYWIRFQTAAVKAFETGEMSLNDVQEQTGRASTRIIRPATEKIAPPNGKNPVPTPVFAESPSSRMINAIPDPISVIVAQESREQSSSRVDRCYAAEPQEEKQEEEIQTIRRPQRPAAVRDGNPPIPGKTAPLSEIIQNKQVPIITLPESGKEPNKYSSSGTIIIRRAEKPPAPTIPGTLRPVEKPPEPGTPDIPQAQK